MKVFLGVAASASVTAAAAELARRLQARVSDAAPHARIAWVAPERFHLTVLFIGHITAAQLSSVREALASPFAEPVFDLAVAGAGTFPSTGRPRVIWAGCGAGVEAFVRLQREAYARIAAVVPLEPEREARPHLTLARVKDPAGLSARTLQVAGGEAPLGTLRVDAVTLFESRSSRAGVEYVAMDRTALVANAGIT